MIDASRVPGMTKEDKTYESECTDSGFISGDITSSPSVSEILEPVAKEACVQDEQMKLDSGIITDSFSHLKLESSGLNDLDNPKKAAKQEKPLYFQQDEDGDTYLHIAIIKGFLEVALGLIRAAPHPKYLDTRNDDAQSPLHLAVATGHPRIVRWLIVAGARPSPRNRRGDSPLHLAARFGDVDCCRAILEPVQVKEKEALALSYPVHYETCQLDQWNFDGQTCVHVAASSGQVEVLSHLVSYGADVNAREGRGGYTPLHIAIEQGDEQLARYLLQNCKTLDVNVLTYGNRSALQLGCPVTEPLTKALLDRGVSSTYSSEDEYDDSSDDEMFYDNASMLISQLVNASA